MFQMVDKETAEKINSMQIPETIEGQGVNVLWVRFVDSSQGLIEIFTGPHQHTFCEVHICLAGSISYQVGGEVVNLVSGKGLAFAPAMEHKYLESQSPDFCKCVLAFSAAEGSEFYSALLGLKPALFDIQPQFGAAFSELLAAVAAADCFSPKLSAAAAFKMIYSVLQTINFPFPKADGELSGSCDPRLAVAKKYIKANYKKMISCEEVAEECGLSVKQMGRIFKKYTDQSLAEYIKDSKLRACEEMLLDSRYSVKQVGYELGFENEYYFNSFFKRKYGMPPGAFRRAKLKNISEEPIDE